MERNSERQDGHIIVILYTSLVRYLIRASGDVVAVVGWLRVNECDVIG